MNSIYFCRLIVLLGSFGFISPLLAQSSPVSTNPGSGPISASTRYDYGSPLAANSNATSGSSGGQGGQSTSAGDPTHSTGSRGVTASRESNSKDSAHPGEKVAVVDLRALPTSATDEKFQGTFLSLKVKSIQEVKPLEEKAPNGGHEDQKSQTNAATVSNDANAKQHNIAAKEKSSSLPDQAKASPATNR